MASVFVRNLPYGVTQEELENVFGDVGPVKKIDLIKDKGKRKSESLTRGFAFVKFAVASDATRAIEQLDGTAFQGRKMHIDMAKEKGKRHENAEKPAHAGKPKPQQEAPKPEPVQEQEEDAKHEADEQVEDVKHKVKDVKHKVKDVKRKVEEAAQPPKEKQVAPPRKEKEPVARVKPTPAAAEAKAKPETPKVTAPAAAAAAVTGHVQSERNARRRQHREFLRQVEQRKESEASAAQKSVVLFGLGADVTQKHVLKKTKKIGPVTKVELKDEPHSGKKMAVVQFEKLKDVAIAVQKLDHHVFKGATLKVRAMAEEQSQSHEPQKAAEGLRLIVRNLAFQTVDADLEKAFGVHGPLFEAHVVRMAVEDPEASADALGRSRGFGFVQFRDVKDARAAVDALNGVKIKGREMVVDFALSKSKYLEQQKQHDVAPQTGASTDAVDGEDDEEEEEGDAIADENDGEASGDEGGDGELELGSDDEADDDEEDEDEEDEEEHPVTFKDDTDAQRERTLFLRNLSFQSTEEGLREFFATFGAVEYARIVMDKGSGLSKGVGFVRFRQREIADAVLARAQAALAEDAAARNKKKKQKQKDNVFALSALADGDALTLDGRMLSVSRAVSKPEAAQLAEENAAQRKQSDKRNMYLAYEGTINVNKLSDEELGLPKLDIDKRRRALREKKEKLKHPLYFVSPVRLSVRNLASSVDDKQLKQLARDAALAGMKAGRVERAEVKRELLPASDHAAVKVRMAKVVRDMSTERPGRAARSRGYGFLEFSEHVHALAALRHLNNNPKYTALAAGKPAAPGAPDSEKSRLLVEFALENHGKLKLREKRRQDAERKREEERTLSAAQGTSAADGDAADTKKSRGQRQREKKKERKLAKEEAMGEDEGKKKKKAPAKARGVVTTQPKKRKRPAADASSDEFGLDAAARVAAKKPKAAAKAEVKAPSRKERKQAKSKAQDQSFDEMVRSYKQELFGSSGSAAQGGNGEARAERWFD